PFAARAHVDATVTIFMSPCFLLAPTSLPVFLHVLPPAVIYTLSLHDALPIFPLKSRTIACLLSLSNLGAINLAHCAFFFTKAGTLIFKVSADCFNFSYSDSLTRKLICLASFRFGRFSPSSCSLMKSHLFYIPYQSYKYAITGTKLYHFCHYITY